MERLKQYALIIWKYIGNRYAILGIIFGFWIIFLDTNNMITQVQMRQELRSLERMQMYYEKEIKKNESEIRRLSTDPDYLERFGREQYMMKKDNEDIFIFVEESTK